MDRHDNKEQDIETRSPQGSPVSPLLFLIYISGVFEKVTDSNPVVMSLFFIDNLGFIASENSVEELAKTLGEVAKVVLEWGQCNAVTYDIAKTEAVFFSRLHCQRLNKEIVDVPIKIGAESIKFNKKTTRWLWIWLDSQLNFTSNMNEKDKKAQTAEI